MMSPHFKIFLCLMLLLAASLALAEEPACQQVIVELPVFQVELMTRARDGRLQKHPFTMELDDTFNVFDLRVQGGEVVYLAIYQAGLTPINISESTRPRPLPLCYKIAWRKAVKARRP